MAEDTLNLLEVSFRLEEALHQEEDHCFTVQKIILPFTSELAKICHATCRNVK